MRTPGRAQLVPVLALSVVTALWGSTFFISKDLLTRIDPLSLLTLRFALATAMMVLIRPAALIRAARRTWLNGLVLGSIYGLAQFPQYVGLRETTASASGFLIGTYVVFTPLLGFLFLRARSSRATYLGVLLAAAGLAAFSFDGLGLGRGELLSLAAAVLYAGHIVIMGRWSVAESAWTLTTVQMIAITVVLAVPTLLRGIEPPEHGSDWLAIGYLSLAASALAIGIQTWAQSRIQATHAAVIMAAEPLWAAGLAVAFTAETVNIRLVVGGSLLLAANIVIALSQPEAPSARADKPASRRSGSSGWGRTSDVCPANGGPARPMGARLRNAPSGRRRRALAGRNAGRGRPSDPR
jgi:drug/metabolite transporter (DMT)-like permease